MASERPNILWICTDQQRFDTIYALGNPHIRTSNLDRLASEGVAFINAYSQNPICTPSRSSFLTGYYPSTLHANRNGGDFFPPDAAKRLIPRKLASTGYDCGLVGKLHLSAAHGRVERRPDDGYRLFRWSQHPYPEPFWPTEQHDYQRWLHEYGVEWGNMYGIRKMFGWDGGDLYSPGIEACYHQTTWCANEAIAFMTEPRQGPWLMSVNPFDPHPPFDPPPEYLERMDVAAMPLPLFDSQKMENQRAFQGIDHQTEEPRPPDSYDARRMVAAYYAQIELIDDQVGRMIQALEESGQRENTIIIFMSDHGEMLGDHGLIFKGCRFYEGAVHVPLIISWPGHFMKDLRSKALVGLIDLAPTLLEATGQPIPADMPGRSLLPILNGEAAPDYHRDFVISEYHDALARPYASHGNMVFDGRYKLCIYHGHEIGELYDLQEDPHEYHNLWLDSDKLPVKLHLMKLCFDTLMLAMDPGPPRTERF